MEAPGVPWTLMVLRSWAWDVSAQVPEPTCSMASGPHGLMALPWSSVIRELPYSLWNLCFPAEKTFFFFLIDAKERKEGGDIVTIYSQSMTLVIDPEITPGSYFLERVHLGDI